MTEYTMLTAIVPAETVETYRAMAAGLHPAGAGMFIIPLYTGEELTHYISTGLIDTEFANLIGDPELFSNTMDIPLEQATDLYNGFSYLACGHYENDSPLMHNKEAVDSLGLSLWPTEGEEEE